jgi:hypothetical protein
MYICIYICTYVYTHILASGTFEADESIFSVSHLKFLAQCEMRGFSHTFTTNRWVKHQWYSVHSSFAQLRMLVSTPRKLDLDARSSV